MSQNLIMRGAAAAALVALGLSLSSCISVLPKVQPVQLYRFSYAPESLGKDAPENVTPSGSPTAVVLGSIDFPQDSGGDRITTTEGNEVAYVGGSRWAVPAEAMFNDAVSEGFARQASTVRLEPRGPSSAPYRLDVVVRRFETVYKHGRATVSVAMDARMTRISDRSVVGQRFITADVGLTHNDMTPMVEAYDKATTQAVGALIAFSQETAAAGADTATLPVAK